MTRTPKIEGVVPVVVAPLTDRGEIDEKGLTRLVEFLVNLNIGGLWVLGTGAEDMNLTYDQRKRMAHIVTEVNEGRVPLMMGASFFALGDCLRFMRENESLEPAAWHVMPYHPLFSLDRLEWFYKHLADHAPGPLWMYTSANWCRAIPPEFVAKMKGYPNIEGIKFSSSNSVHNEKVISLADDEFQVACAVVRQFNAVLSLGVKAFTTSEASPLPEPIIEIYELYTSGRHAEALAAQRRFNRCMEDFPKDGPFKDNFLKTAEEKYILELRGICNRYTTNYYRDVTEEEGKVIEEALRRHGLPPFTV